MPHQSQPSFADVSGTASSAQLPVATTSAPGAVKPDGTTITIDGSGKISAATGGSGNVTGTGTSVVGNVLCANNTTATALVDCGYAKNAIPAANLSYTAPFTGAVARTQSSKNGDVISILDFGGDPTGTNDNLAAYNAAVAALNTAFSSSGYGIDFPAGVYLTSGELSIPATLPVYLEGAGAGATIIRAMTGFTANAVVFRGTANTVFYCGVSNMTIDGNLLAAYPLYIEGGIGGSIEHLYLINPKAGDANFRCGDGTNHCENFYISDIFMDSQAASSSSQYPFANLYMQGYNNTLVGVVGNKATYCNIEDDATAAGNHYFAPHGYNYPTSSLPTYNVCLNGNQSTATGAEADGASTAGFLIDGHANTLSGSTAQFQSVTNEIGLSFGNAAAGSVASGNTLTTTFEGVSFTGGAKGNVAQGNNIIGTTTANGVVDGSGNTDNLKCNNYVSGTNFGLATSNANCN